MKVLLVLLLPILSQANIAKEFLEGNLKFSASVYKQLSETNEGKFLVCPMSVETIFALVHAGARGSTASQISEAFHFPKSSQEIQNIFKQLSPTLTHTGNYNLSTANKVYVQYEFKIKDEFKSIATETFNAHVEEIDFTKKATAIDSINNWVEQQTYEKIKHLLSESDISDLTKAVLINAMYFKGHFVKKFNEFDTEKHPFYMGKGKTIDVDTMETTSSFKYFESTELKYLQMPFEGGDISLDIILPTDREGLSATSDKLEEILREPELTMERVHVKLPKFEIETPIKFTEILQKLGVVDIFVESKADLKGISDTELVVTDVIQKAFIQVDESGTTAAAATAVISNLALPFIPKPKESKQFIADHPFTFILRHKYGIMFVGSSISTPLSNIVIAIKTVNIQQLVTCVIFAVSKITYNLQMSIKPTLLFLIALIIHFTEHDQTETENITTSLLEEDNCPGKDTIQLCPEGLNTFAPGVCYILIENQTFPPSCPYNNFLPYSKIKYMISILGLVERSIWIHTIRNTSRGFGNYEWIEQGDCYGQSINNNNVNTSEFNPTYNCMVVRNGIFIPTSCLTPHDAFCVYAYNTSRFCANNAKSRCITSHFDFNNGKCFCKKVLEPPYPQKRQTCSKLAEPVHPFQNFMLLQSFHSSQTCWIGIEKMNSTYGYISSQHYLSYNYFSKDANCNQPEVAMRLVADRGWALLNDSTLSCSFCEVTIKPEKVRLDLYHDVNRDELNLMIYNPHSISDWNGKYNLYCFSNVNLHDFNFRLDLNIEGFDLNSTVFILKISPIVQYPGHYWCAAFQFDDNSVTYSNTIVTYNRTIGYGYEYSLLLHMKTVSEFPLLNKLHVFICNLLHLRLAERKILSLRPMSLSYFNYTSKIFEIVAHLTTRKTKESHLHEYNYLMEKIKLINASSDLTISTFLSASICFSENTITDDGEVLEWPETIIGVNAIPVNKLCLDTNMVPVTRKCGGDFMHGARWLSVKGVCVENVSKSDSTNELLHLLKDATFSDGIEENLANTTEHNEKNVTVIDIYLISRILDTIVINSNNVNDVSYFKTISNLMTYNRSTLRGAQVLLNSTDEVLFCIDTFLSSLNDGYQYESDHLFVAIIDLHRVESVTLIVYDNRTNVDILNNELNFDDVILKSDVEVAIYLSHDVINYVKSQTAPYKPLKLIVSVFYNDFLFNEVKQKKFLTVGKKVVSIFITEFQGFLKTPIRVMFKHISNDTYYRRCAFWDYGWDQLMTSKYGHWKSDNNLGRSNDIYYCEFYHTTHFGILLLNPTIDIPEKHEKYLNIVSYVGLGLSLMGVFPIFLTAIVHRTWRRRPATIILIQLCVTIAFQAILVFLNELVTIDGILCTVIGVGIHYFVLSEFCWMIVIGHLQYLKFVVIMKPPPSNILQISSIIGWGTPLFPVFVTLAISSSNYGLINGKYCYLKENYFLFFLLLPIVIIFSVNVYIFTRIFCSIYHVNKSSVARVTNFRAEISLAVLLFFMLGLTWAFAFFATMKDGVAFAYMFYVAVSVRGFVLFLFFVVRNKEVRHLWIKEIPKASSRISEVTTDHSST
ncbi:hypothetical protein RI129_001397 [Pyrocoelia pectoralis]|uniref:G-protein coupled receptors family 2 profile 2 domain-containing protein n=1 Tax=Pyrocoelia pectoralis TaxID=417401 RepID=A0AAN7VWX3_9COLE